MTYQHDTNQINQLADKLEDPELDTKGLGWKAAFHLRELQGRIAELEAQLYAIGAGGVGQSIKPQVQADTPQPTAADQEPAATVQTINGVTIGYLKTRLPDGTKLYTAPQPTRQPLTEDQLRDALRQCPHDTTENLRVRWLYAKDFARAIEAAHGITGGQQ